MPDGPKILTLDIERSPNVADVWGLFDQTVSLAQLRETSRVISFAAKWHGVRGVKFFSDFHNGHEVMVQNAYDLLDEADLVVHYNGTRYDLPNLRQEFLLAGMPPSHPVQEVDLLKVVRKHFSFTSNKLQHVTTELGLGGKVKHAGHELWTRCMAGDPAAWTLMRRYNIGDVKLTEALYDRLRPWISNHPALGLLNGEEWSCNRCGSTDLERRGYAYTATSVFIQVRCRNCGGWSRKTTREGGVRTRGVA